MNQKLLDLAARRGALQHRISSERGRLASHLDGLSPLFAGADAAVRGVDWVKRHPLEVGALLAAIVAVRPSRAWRWGKRGFVVWRTWQALRSKLLGPR